MSVELEEKQPTIDLTDEETPRLAGYLAEFATVDDVIHAARKVREAGFTRWDVHSPFPIHGIDSAMGIRMTVLPWIVLVAGLTGLTFGIFMQWWVNASPWQLLGGLPSNFQGYEFLISGKPIWSLPANIPAAFETTVLFSAFTAGLGMLVLNQLPCLYNPLLKSERFRRATSDRFFVVIEASDPKFDANRTQELLNSLKPAAVEAFED